MLGPSPRFTWPRGKRDIKGSSPTATSSRCQLMLAKRGGRRPYVTELRCFSPSKQANPPVSWLTGHVAMMKPPAACGEIYALYVDPHAWSTGTGQQLHDGALAVLTADGSTVVTLWVLTSNDRARRFYSRRGWQLDGATKIVELDAVTLSEVRYKRTLETE